LRRAIDGEQAAVAHDGSPLAFFCSRRRKEGDWRRLARGGSGAWSRHEKKKGKAQAGEGGAVLVGKDHCERGKDEITLSS
jgi:hypothetical protein